MTVEIIWDDEALKNLRKLDENIACRIVKKIRNIRLNPERYVFSLVNMSLSKLRVGDYRIFVDYYRDDGELFIRSIKHRKNAYKK